MLIKIRNFLILPFLILNIRIIQYKYKKRTINNYTAQSSSNTAILTLLQAKEEYYFKQLSAWGKYHPKFSFTHEQYTKHINFLNWLFPLKDFKEFDIVVWHKYDAVTYYHNKIYRLQEGKSCNYELEIINQIKEWKSASERDLEIDNHNYKKHKKHK